MNIKRLLFAIILPIAIYPTHAQTPESIRKSCPPMPSVNTLKTWALDNCEPVPQNIADEVNGLHDKIYANKMFIDGKIDELKALGDIEEKKAAEIDRQQVDKTVKATTGRSLQELENMSEDESDAFAAQMVKSMTGMSMAQIEALDGKSDAEILAAMQQSGTMGKVMGQAAATNPVATPDANKITRIHELQQEMQTLAQRAAADALRLDREEAALKAKHEAMLKPGGEFAKLMELKKALNSYSGLVTANDMAEVKRLCAQVRPMESAYYDKIIPEWLKFVNGAMETHKQMKTVEDRIAAIGFELTDMQGLSATAAAGSATHAKISPWDEVRTYLTDLDMCLEFVKP